MTTETIINWMQDHGYHTHIDEFQNRFSRQLAQLNENAARADSLAADLADAVVRADKAERDLATSQFEAATLRADRDAAEEERDEARATIDALREEAHACDVHNGVVIPEPRPLTPDAITDEMVERALASFEKDRPGIHHFPWMIRNALTAALTVPPKRPEWADAPAVLAHRESEQDAPTRVWTKDGEDVWASGTHRAHTRFLRGVTPLYPEGVRVVGEERS